MVCLSRPYHFKYFKGYLPQLIFGPFLNTLTHIRNKGISTLQKRKKKCYNELNMNSITYEREFWKTIKPFLSDKVTSQTKI